MQKHARITEISTTVTGGGVAFYVYSIALLHHLRGRVYGQDIAIEEAVGHIRRHIMDPSPPKALVLSFNGPTGVGKSYMSTLIAQHLYVNGMKSKFVRRFSQLGSFTDISKIPEYQVGLLVGITYMTEVNIE